MVETRTLYVNVISLWFKILNLIRINTAPQNAYITLYGEQTMYLLQFLRKPINYFSTSTCVMM